MFYRWYFPLVWLVFVVGLDRDGARRQGGRGAGKRLFAALA